MKTLANCGEVKNYLTSFGKKICDVFAVAMAGQEMEGKHNAFLKALRKWRDCYKTSSGPPQLPSSGLVSTATH